MKEFAEITKGSIQEGSFDRTRYSQDDNSIQSSFYLHDAEILQSLIEEHAMRQLLGGILGEE